MEASTKNVEATRGPALQCKEPVNGQFEDCTKKMLPGVETESSSDEEDQNFTTEQFKMIVINVCYVCNGNKVAFLSC